MANMTAQMVKELRERTGVGMMDCKAALQETAGAIEQAVDLLRKRGLAKAAKKAGRIAAEGLIGVAMEDSKGVVVEVNSETDFVARNDLFQGLVKMIANVALAVGPDVEKIKAAKVGDITLAEAIADTIAKIGESGLRTFYKEVCLVDQAYIHDPDKTVSQAMKDSEGKLGAPIKVTGFIRYALGEGIDRPDSDFGGEVAALVTSS